MSGIIRRTPGTLVSLGRYAPTRWSSNFARDVADRLGGKISPRYRHLVSPDHPAQRLLSLELPGVYRHSLLVGSAAAIAAHKIGADPDRASVIGYFHDIGKITAPAFFSGAVSGNRLLAKELDTSEKLAILLGHARASAAFIRANFPDVPEEIILGVEEHHGLMRTFANISPPLQAELAGEFGPEWGERALRYPGPRRPQSPEAALVMLADGVEALLATLSSAGRVPTRSPRSYFQAVVSHVFLELTNDGQFVESGLSDELLGIAEGVMLWPFFRFYNGLDLIGTPEHLRKHGRD